MEGKKIALFFGSFNPIHNAHIMIAQQIVDSLLADEVWFVVSPHNPLKEISALADVKHRLAMAKLAIENNPQFQVSNIELSLPCPSYTIDTLKALKTHHHNRQFSIIIGADNLRDFHKWYNHTDIIENHKLIVYPRPDVMISEIPLSTHTNIQILNAHLSPISSTQIRQLITQLSTSNQDATLTKLTTLLPQPVITYIISNHLYINSDITTI